MSIEQIVTAILGIGMSASFAAFMAVVIAVLRALKRVGG